VRGVPRPWALLCNAFSVGAPAWDIAHPGCAAASLTLRVGVRSKGRVLCRDNWLHFPSARFSGSTCSVIGRGAAGVFWPSWPRIFIAPITAPQDHSPNRLDVGRSLPRVALGAGILLDLLGHFPADRVEDKLRRAVDPRDIEDVAAYTEMRNRLLSGLQEFG
jgi:hypothetical protein